MSHSDRDQARIGPLDRCDDLRLGAINEPRHDMPRPVPATDLGEPFANADVLIDTSHLNVNQLRARVEEMFAGEDARREAG